MPALKPLPAQTDLRDTLYDTLFDSCEMFRQHAIGFAKRYAEALEENKVLEARIVELETDVNDVPPIQETRARKGEWR